MCDTSDVRSAGQGQSRHEQDRHHRDRQDDSSRSRQANFPVGRRGLSRSPRRDAHRKPGLLKDRDRDMNQVCHHYRSGRGREFRDQYYERGEYESMYDDLPRKEDHATHHDDERKTHDYRDRPASYYNLDDPRNRSRSPGRYRSRSPSLSRDAGRPSDTVILEGLPDCVGHSELRESILKTWATSENPPFDVRIAASKGHRRAFVQFEYLSCAVNFVQEHYPKVLINLRRPTDEVPEGYFDAYLHYARARDDRDGRGSSTDWKCQQCEASNFSTRTVCRDCGAYPSGIHWRQSLTGAADAADAPSQMLVVFPLPPFADEEMLAREMKRLELEKPDAAKTVGETPKLKSTAPTSSGQGFGASQGSLHRVFLMRDTQTNESFKYGFAEFWTLEDTMGALKKFSMARGFTIAGCAVTISTIHLGVFLPEDRELTPKVESRSFHPLFNSSIRVRYRDEHVYPSQLVVAAEPPGGVQDKATSEEQEEAKRNKKRKADGALGNASKKPLAMAGKMAMWQRKHDELHGEKGQEISSEAGDGAKLQPSKLSSANTTIKISLSSLSKLTKKPEVQSEELPASTPSPGKESVDSDSKAVSYVDRDRLMCLICMRKYKSIDEVNIHERSRNHKMSTENHELVKAALPRLVLRDKRLQRQQYDKAGADSTGTTSSDASSQYRDRAKERREVYSQPKKPVMHNEPSKDKMAVPATVVSATTPAASKGASLLAKMGWTAGGGLGANGEGRTEVIETNAYQKGVGLGAEGSNLGDAAERADRQTRGGYSGYLSTVQDKARERYNKLG